MVQEDLPGRGETGSATGTEQQRGAHGVLEVADLHAQGRLGDVKPSSGAPEVQLFGDSDEVPQDTQLEGWLHVLTV